MFTSELDILDHCFQSVIEEQEEIKNGIVIKRIEDLPCKPSTSIAAIGYDHENCILFIQFYSGNTYRYFNAPLTLWQRFITTTGSVGRLYHQEIKGNFKGGQVENLI
ncbi:KTSC domain-containing protein [Crocosphaera sp. UHCC 0190]|uniref:KTSC domain-containing protein n=1 Tax=Crocosphaera sp. UHCC 0190 TaxID=3110246 RepID=UPI002B21AAD7|nr:KTSC domain-containing protein [Crocosphaera sp. UHCC 0190]MEA5512248.1 KTSC domain-containing protein [Crocosphaera sp. UHCC 0190]